jgi:hypothetical protein
MKRNRTKLATVVRARGKTREPLQAGSQRAKRSVKIALDDEGNDVLRWEKSLRATAEWEQGFRAAAKADRYEVLREHLAKLERPDKPRWLLEGTVQGVREYMAYASAIPDKHPSAGPTFLRMQKYNSTEVPEAEYALTFDLPGPRYARLLVLPDIWPLDLADFYGYPWRRWPFHGYCRFWITRTDGNAPGRRELARLERAVTDDLRCDFSENELIIQFMEYSADERRQIIEQAEYDNEDEEALRGWLDGCSPNRGTVLVTLDMPTLSDDMLLPFFRTMLASRWLRAQGRFKKQCEATASR